MKNRSETIRKFINYLNNPDQEGGFWLPNIQRAFVWKEEQIEKLYDSILREYPIGSLLVWKTNTKIRMRKFIDNFNDSIRLTDFFIPPNDKQKILILDGQQRLQSLYIGLKGSYNGKELCFNILSGDLAAPDDIKFQFSFLDRTDVTFPWVLFKEVISTDKRKREIKESIINIANNNLSESENSRIDDNIEISREVFCTQSNIIYQEIDSIDRPKTYTDDDVVEIFIRANSGGTILSKSDLMFSLLISSWDEAEENMIDLLNTINKTGYLFTRDFVLKTCLVLLNTGARFSVEKLRSESNRKNISIQWTEFSNAIKDVKDFIYSKTYLRTDKTIPSYLSLIPMIYFRYNYKSKWKEKFEDLQTYLLRASLSGVFSGSPDNLIDKIINRIKRDQDFKLKEIFGIIREDGRSLEISNQTILNLNYWKKELHLFLNIWYGFNYQPAFTDNKPQVDHIFPQKILKLIKEENPETGKMNLMKYKWPERDQIGNLMLLTQAENGPGCKADKPPDYWFEDKDDNYLNLHLIPTNKHLWKVENFEKFIEERKKLIIEKFSFFIIKEEL